jgi:nitrite reductase (NADH) small subunit/3-phenylpropionate/trans-cinnamate dioxygenase ferredoxin subunit
MVGRRLKAVIHPCRVDEVADGASKLVRLPDGREVAVFRRDGRWFAFENLCPHKGGPLGQGQEKGGILTCPWHRFRFYLETGISVTNPDMHATAFEALVDGDKVAIILPDRDPTSEAVP